MNDAYERRALLLHLGDVLESLYCLSRVSQHHKTLAAALKHEDSLAEFAWLAHLDPRIAPGDVAQRATAAFFLWPKSLLDEELNRALLASTVKHDLFANNSAGWNAYVADRQREVAWFGEGLDVPPAAREASPAPRATRWPWPDDA